MKTLRISIVALAAFALFLTVGCEKIDFTEEVINNAPTESNITNPKKDTGNDLNYDEKSNKIDREKLADV